MVTLDLTRTLFQKTLSEEATGSVQLIIDSVMS